MSSVPAPALGPLVGREPELERLESLAAEGARLLVLLGPPGIGKTRLATELARRLRDPVWIDLSQVGDVDEAAARLALALDVRTSWVELTPEQTNAAPTWLDELGWALQARPEVVLFVDEADALGPAVGPLLADLLAAAPTARAVVTSRERLGITGETLIEVGPLSTQASRTLSPAARLLALRAGRAGTDVDERRVLEQVASALDGVPLAIELAAARLHALGPDELLARLPTHLDLSGGEGRASLRDALVSSWSRLGEPERRALACCAVFRSAFDLRAAEAVIGADALGALQELRDRSLVARDGSRFRLYASVRQFAAERAKESGEDEHARDRHRVYFVARANEERAAQTRGDAAAEARLVASWSELEHAYAHAEEPERTALLLGIATARIGRVASPELLDRLERATKTQPDEAGAIHALRGRALESAGRMDDAVDALRRAHELAPDDETRALRAAALAHAELTRGDVTSATAHVEEAVAQAPSGSLARARAWRTAGLVAHARGRLDDARDAYVEALDLARELGLDAEVAGLRADLGAVRLQQRRLEEAREDYEAAIVGLDPELDPIRRGLAEGNLAILEQEEGRPERASELFLRATERLQRAGHRLFTAHLQVYAGALAHEQDHLDVAVGLYDAARSSLRRVGDARLIALASALGGALEAQRGRSAAAAEAFTESERALTRVDDPGVIAAVRVHRAQLLANDEALAILHEHEGSEAVASSDDLRLALRLLRRRLGHGSVRVDEEARALVLPDGTHVELANRLVLWRLVAALLVLRETSPGEPLSIEAAIDAGWPGERMTGDSGTNRLKVALSTLRKLGLRELLVRHDSGGYLLDPNVPIVRA
ncbi:MAG: AAA family ATPase [Sandaracinus sp.]|nr:AAA family ATPase [Sandaracinus sp.]MCB9612318.1 AAA family ATPase [Sandaracinus sp.]